MFPYPQDRKAHGEQNPFKFRHVIELKNASHFDDVGPCVLMATPSGLQSGACAHFTCMYCCGYTVSGYSVVEYTLRGCALVQFHWYSGAKHPAFLCVG